MKTKEWWIAKYPHLFPTAQAELKKPKPKKKKPAKIKADEKDPRRDLLEKILGMNDAIAQRNRAWLAQRGVTGVF